MIDLKKQNTAIHPVAAGVAGAIIGAGVAVVAAVAMKDEKTQKKVKEVLDNVKEQAKEYIGKAKIQTHTQQGKLNKDSKESKKQPVPVSQLKRLEEKLDDK